MGLYASRSAEVRDLEGLHLYHFFLSNCSQRVRFALEEKGLPWTSHHLDLSRNEHVTAAYQAINPNGVVPTLVHDGRVVIESNDILVYLDEHFPEPSLTPDDPAERESMRRHMGLASQAQGPFKVLSHELLFRKLRVVSPEDVALFEARHADPSLAAFLRDYAENGAAWRRRVREARTRMEEILGELEAALARSPWLSGSRFGLADVSWSVNANRFRQARYPLDAFPAFEAWFEKLATRPAFDRAVLSYRPG